MISSSDTSLSTSLTSTTTISILSYNILLPNSTPKDEENEEGVIKSTVKGGGWWVYKMYSPRHHLDENLMTWEYRSSLLQNEIKNMNCDIVCYQEINPNTYLIDFNFMKELGYDQSVIYKKGQFCPAIFWKSNKVIAISEPFHRDRCLIIPFQMNLSSSSCNSHDTGFQLPIYVCNCHLQAGINNSERRLRQIHDALETIRKHVTKLIMNYIDLLKKKNKKKKKENTSSTGSTSTTSSPFVIDYEQETENLLKSTPIILLGDMNCDPVDSCGAHSLLVYGEATVEGKLCGDVNDERKDLSIKRHPFTPFIDTYEYAYQESLGSVPPPTMIVEELYDILTIPLLVESPDQIFSSLLSPLAQYHLQLSSIALERLRLMFDKYAHTSMSLTSSDDTSSTGPHTKVMSYSEIKRWLTDINKIWNRGSEFHATKLRIKVMNDCEPHEGETCQISTSEVLLNVESLQIQDEENSDDTTTMTFPENCYLGWEEYRSIYEQMIAEGKVWAVSSDMATCGFPLPDSCRVYTARYDRIYISGSLKNNLISVRDIPCGSIEEGCPGIGGCLPNAMYPSDHLAVAASISIPN